MVYTTADPVRGSLAAFMDGRFAYRRLFAELWGTFLLVLVAAGAGVVGALPAGSEITLLMKTLAPGFMVIAIVYFMGTVSGAHINPVITITFAVRRQFPWSALAFGLYIALAGMWGAPISGASMNPARTIGPDLVALDFTVTWVYIVGPLLGGVVAIVFDRVLHGPPSSASDSAAQGLLEPDDPAAI